MLRRSVYGRGVVFCQRTNARLTSQTTLVSPFRKVPYNPPLEANPKARASSVPAGCHRFRSFELPLCLSPGRLSVQLLDGPRNKCTDGSEGKPLPFGYRWAVANGLTSFHAVARDRLRGQVVFFRREFEAETGIDCWPFAQRQDMDDVAVFVVEDGAVQDRVIAVHTELQGHAGPPRPPASLPGLLDWLSQMVLPEMAMWATEADISEALGYRARGYA